MYQDSIPITITVQLDELWMPLANGWTEDVENYLQKTGYNSAATALRDLRADVLECAEDLRELCEIEAAIMLEKLADDMLGMLQAL